jgi:hypothetical protein
VRCGGRVGRLTSRLPWRPRQRRHRGMGDAAGGSNLSWGGGLTAGVGRGGREERNQDATCYCGNLDGAVSEQLLWELMLQAGPVIHVHVPRDRITNETQGFGFVEFRSEEDADYAIKIMNMVKMFGKPIRVNKASQDKKSQDVGANLFIGNLDEQVDEKILYDTFSAFGVVCQTPKIMRDPETGNSRGFGFIGYDSFEAADAAIEAMNGQFLANRQINVTYAYKKDTKGERHGTVAERILAANNQRTASRPHMLFAAAPTVNSGGPPPPPPGMGGSIMPPPPPPPGAHAVTHMAASKPRPCNRSLTPACRYADDGAAPRTASTTWNATAGHASAARNASSAWNASGELFITYQGDCRAHTAVMSRGCLRRQECLCQG